MYKFKTIVRVFLFILISCFFTGCEEAEEVYLIETTEITTSISSSVETERVTSYYPKAENFAGGNGTKENPYLVENAGQLALLSYVFSEEGSDFSYKYKGAYFKQAADIVINDPVDIDNWSIKAPKYSWLPIGSYHDFNCNYDGNNHSISGLYIYDEGADGNKGVGLFGNVSDAVICNVVLEHSYFDVKGSGSYGSIAGWSSNSRIDNCTSKAVIVAKENTLSNVGGVVGTAYDSTINACCFEGKIQSSGTVGGIVGRFSGNAKDCLNSGIIKGLDPIDASVGGIFGEITPGLGGTTIESCRNKGEIRACGYCSLGGIVGFVTVQRASELVNHEWVYTPGRCSIIDCVNEGKVTGEECDSSASIGGIIGQLFSTEYMEYAENCLVANCNNYGEIIADGYCGGILGSSSMFRCPFTLYECVNEAKIIAPSYAGGIMGYCQANMQEKTIAKCINKGEVISGDSGGGILGAYFGFNLGVKEDNETYITECHNLGKISGTRIGGIVGSGMDITKTVYVDSCINEGEIAGGDSARAGGILGEDTLAYLVKTDDCIFKITNCVNYGNVSQGDGKYAFDFNIKKFDELETSIEDLSESDILAVIIGSPCIGGICGSNNQSIIENCINVGRLWADEDYVYIIDEADMVTALKDDSKASIFAGGICGQYFFMEHSDSLESTGIYNCVYEKTAPIGYSDVCIFFDIESVRNVIAVDESMAKKAAKELGK